MKTSWGRIVRMTGAALLVLGHQFLATPALAESASGAKIGIVLMHGKGGMPTGHVAELARQLQTQGILLANLEMPWSKQREYDVPVSAGVAEVETALAALRGQGAHKLFVAGHSQGGVFAFHLGTRLKFDGLVAIAPGGNVANAVYAEKLGSHIAQARRLLADGKGGEKMAFADYEGAKGTFPVLTTPAIYLSWFDPDGAMNQAKSAQEMNPAIPVLYVAPTQDYPGLQRVKQQMFGALPKNPLTKMVQPQASHTGAPTASVQLILDWTLAVATAP